MPSISQIKQAFNTLNQPPNVEDNDYASTASNALASEIYYQSGASQDILGDLVLCGVFLFVTADIVSSETKSSFEVSSTAGATMLLMTHGMLKEDVAESIRAIGQTYNGMNQKILEAIGNTIIKWITNPSTENFIRLVELFQLIRDQ